MSETDKMDGFEWLSHQEEFRKIHDGTALTPERLGRDFLRLNAEGRSNILANLNRKIRSTELTMNEAVRLHSFRSRLISAHEAARRVKR
jgi:hypothetical protein